MYFKRKAHCLVAFIMSALLCVTVLSACNKTEEVQTEETTIKTAVTSEATSQTLSEEELNALAQDMPEIVFVMSHHFDNPNIDGDETNILGYYITNSGEVKLYDFRTIAPDEIYEIPDVYDRLEEVTCSEIYDIAGDAESSVALSKEVDLVKSIPEYTVEKCYERLLNINGNVIENQYEISMAMDIGHYRFYGVKVNKKGEREFVLLKGRGQFYDYDNSDPDTSELLSYIEFIQPSHLYYYHNS